jgi:20S proteasome alpha/beta subunit
MTFILGSKCKDGVVLVADRKVSFPETGNLRYRTKLFVGNPIVVGTAGFISGLDILRDHFIKVASNLDKSVNADSLKQKLENIANNINKEFKEVKNQGHDLLIVMKTNDKGATLHRFYPGGSFDPVEDYEAIGSGEPYGSVFLKLLWGRERTMQEVAELGFFIIKYIEDLKLNDSVVGDQDPQICFIPDHGEINEAGSIELNRFRTSSLNRLNRYKNYIVEGYESGPAKQSLESLLQEIKPFDIEVFTEIYSWQGEHIPFVKFNDD